MSLDRIEAKEAAERRSRLSDHQARALADHIYGAVGYRPGRHQGKTEFGHKVARLVDALATPLPDTIPVYGPERQLIGHMDKDAATDLIAAVYSGGPVGISMGFVGDQVVADVVARAAPPSQDVEEVSADNLDTLRQRLRMEVDQLQESDPAGAMVRRNWLRDLAAVGEGR